MSMIKIAINKPKIANVSGITAKTNPLPIASGSLAVAPIAPAAVIPCPIPERPAKPTANPAPKAAISVEPGPLKTPTNNKIN